MRNILIVKLLIILFSVNFPSSATAQTLSPSTKISLLTCGSGDELYSIFGHSAIRVCDTTQQFDLIFNYGIFDFQDPNFYMNFVRGKLNYKLGISDFSYFIEQYREEKRWVYEQELNLTVAEQQALFNFLIQNYQPENRYYLYDFLFDNCSSRIRDVLVKVLPNQITFPNNYLDITDGTSFRDLLHSYLNGRPWTKLGIDILLGKRVDRPVAANEFMFLPDYLLEAFGRATINGEPLVIHSEYLYHSPEAFTTKKTLFVPLIVLITLLVLSIVAHAMKLPLKWFDVTIFFILGILGILLVFMWLGTDHYVTKYNLNLLWALPTHCIVAFILLKRKLPRWTLWYFAANTLLCLILLIFWRSMPQQLNNALIPIVCIVGFRSYVYAKSLFFRTSVR